MYRQLKRNKKKKSLLFKLSLILVILISSTLCYGFYQYKKGIQLGEMNSNKKTIKFNSTKIPNKTNILLLGEDARKKGESSRTDSIMILQYNKKHETKLVSIMRDSYVSIPGYGKHKINAAYSFGGVELLRQTIQQNFGIDIEYYAIIDFKGFEEMIDQIAPKGVTINVEKPMESHIGVSLQPGVQQLNGKELLGYTRFRHDAKGDFDRVVRQQKVLEAIKSQVLSLKGIASLPKTLGVIQPYIQTNMSTMDVLKIGSDYMVKGKDKDVETLRIPVDGAFTPKRYEKAGEVLDLDAEKNKEVLQVFLR
ncbi:MULTISPECIES: LCP family protein [Bacillaceae]|uniref:LCP family protein n=1 Tax=Bacillaceae TaxID=186817 RepID=UPI000BED93CE|nr:MULTISPECIES: LCP family protein [unclassified Bacillus (in: firmicutes)]PEC48386.1 transcriptional regulator [Bacillus sp. AFS096315]PFM81190.1 transcriptional regulator [Bacillus sp. AFS077874]